MRLASRLSKLEKHRRETGDCPRCEGRGWPHMFVQGKPDGEFTTKPGDRVGCERCGRVAWPKLVILDKDEPNPLEAWLAAGGKVVGG